MTLAYWDGIDDHEPPAFATRVTRRGRSRGITRPVERRLLRRRVGVLALAIAVPAMATPDMRDVVPGLSSPRAGQVAPLQPLVAPVDPEFAAWAPAPGSVPAAAHAPAAGGLAPALPLLPAASPATGPAARAFSMGGSFTDKLRAEECLTMAIYYEAASESIEGQRAVAQVVMNRMHHPSYPNTVCGVVFQGSQRTTGCQFSFTCDGSLARRPQPSAWNRARRVASAALGGFVFAPVGLATHYHRTDIMPYWASSLTVVGTIGLHRFYRWSGRAGTLAAFSARYGGGEPLPVRAAPALSPAPEAAASAFPAEIVAAAAAAGPLAGAVVPVAAVDGVPGPAPVGQPDLFPQSGQVRDIYARSGTWLRQP